MGTDVAENDRSEPGVLYVVADRWAEDAIYLVTAETVARAAEAAARPGVPETFGELRRADDLDELERRISQFADIDAYVAAIERVAGRQPASDRLEERLAALVDVEFGGTSPTPPASCQVMSTGHSTLRSGPSTIPRVASGTSSSGRQDRTCPTISTNSSVKNEIRGAPVATSSEMAFGTALLMP